MVNKYRKYSAGFTLIELLVVVAIIALLAAIVLVSLVSARRKARDSRRLADMTQMNTALELYKNTNAGYPDAVAGKPQSMTPTYLNLLPSAPVPADSACEALTNPLGGQANNYYYEPTGTSSLVGGLTVWSDYNYYFCLGSQTGNFSSGLRTMTPKGVK